jgi:RecJ-like exonuclease
LERLLSIFDQHIQVEGDAHRLDYPAADGKLKADQLLQRVLRRLHQLQTDPDMERIMSAEDVFELEQKRIHEDLTRELRLQLAEERMQRQEEQRIRIEAEQEIARLRKLLDDRSSS